MKRSRTFRKKARVALLILLMMGIGLQFFRPPLENPPVTGDIQAPPEVKAILRRACYDCHSNETRLAWFDQPVPAYWLVVKDVNDGRRVLNFSNWDSLTPAQQEAKLFESVMQIEQHAMPQSNYTLLHHKGVISAGNVDLLKRYVGGLAYHPVVDTERVGALRRQEEEVAHDRWRGNSRGPDDEFNGIGYKELALWPYWEAVSMTERYDNGTLRVIYGNDVAIKAVRSGQINPYPDGAIFAKAAWDQLPDSTGEIRTGAFKQVEFMIRDSKSHPSTFGWGWARWVGGLQLKPYGKDASFVTECINCHRPLDKTDHTFTFPLSDTPKIEPNLLPDSLDGRPLRCKVITSFVDAHTKTMSTLYGDQKAFAAAVLGQYQEPGSTFILATWSQREDPHWFGGRIPNALLSVEVLRYRQRDTATYDYFEGPDLKRKVPSGDSLMQRIDYIRKKKVSPLPFR